MSQPAPSLRERIYRTDAVVIGRHDLGEADRILTLFTPHHGKVRAVAKGVRRPGSRFAPHVELFSHSHFILHRGRGLDVVTAAEVREAFPAFRGDYERYAWASHLAELLNRLTEDGQEQPPLYDLIVRSYRLLDGGTDPWLVARHFEVRILELAGFRPDIYRCVACETDLAAEVNYLSNQFGGLLCARCRGQDPHARALSLNAQKFLRLVDREGIGAAARLQLPEPLRHEIEVALGGYLAAVGERDFASLRVLHAMERSVPRQPAPPVAEEEPGEG